MSFRDYLGLTWFESWVHLDELARFIALASPVSPKDLKR